MSTGRTRERANLSRDAIVEAAVAIVDAGGPDALTMRAVADRLGAGTMSLYRHVAGREELLDLVLASMTAEVPVHAVTGDWAADLAQVARDVRAALLLRPQLTILLTSRMGAGSGGIALLDRALGILRTAGFGPQDAVLANNVLGNYVAGAALWEAVGLQGTSGPERTARLAATAATVLALPADEYPAVAWAGNAIVSGSLDERFEFGLQVLVAGLAARLRASRGEPIA